MPSHSIISLLTDPHLFCLHSCLPLPSFFFFFNATATTEIYTLSLHDALPISRRSAGLIPNHAICRRFSHPREKGRSEEHTSELQSRPHLVCRLLLEKKKSQDKNHREVVDR